MASYALVLGMGGMGMALPTARDGPLVNVLSAELSIKHLLSRKHMSPALPDVIPALHKAGGHKVKLVSHCKVDEVINVLAGQDRQVDVHPRQVDVLVLTYALGVEAAAFGGGGNE